ncbi:MAG: glycosyltransferase [Acidimicrobiales bacterium]
MTVIFVTVGSAYPFDRLIRACDELAAADPTQDWLAQIHEGEYQPQHMRFERYMDKPEFDAAMAGADLLVGHAGMGTINGALALHKPLLVLARRKEFGEHVNDHQVAGAELFGAGGHVLVADTAEDVASRLADLTGFVPAPREVRATELADQIGAFLSTC